MSSPPPIGQNETPMDVLLQHHRPIISSAYLTASPEDEAQAESDYWDAVWLSAFLPQAETLEEVLHPISDIFYPIIGDANNKIELMDGTYSTTEHKVVGLFSMGIYWKDMITDILPHDSNGILVSWTSEECDIEPIQTTHFVYFRLSSKIPVILPSHMR